MKIFIYSVIGIVAAAIIAGFFIAGSPKNERLLMFDGQRVNDLQNIQGQILYFWQSKNKLPDKLSDLNDSLRGVNVPKDPETGAEYSYKVNPPLSFDICANFDLPSESTNFKTSPRMAPTMPAPYGGYYPAPDQNWEHGAGNACFSRTIDKDFYPPVKPVK